MKKLLSFLIAALMLVALAAPSFGFTVDDPALDELNGRLTGFSAKMYSLMTEGDNADANFTVSPVSIYFALAMLHYSGDDGVKREVEEFTGMTAADFEASAELFKWLEKTHLDERGEVAARLSLSNSAWINEDKAELYDDGELQLMAEKLLNSVESAPFLSDNEEANKKVKEFIKEKTGGLIDRDFGIPAEMVLALVNTLYFKDNWDLYGDDLPTVKKYFTARDGVKTGDFVTGHYSRGQIAETGCSYFFTAETSQGYKMKFILPKDGFGVSDVMSGENLALVNSTSDFGFTDGNGAEHYTRCVFPEFKSESDTDLKALLMNAGFLDHAFTGYDSRLLAKDSDVELALTKMQHVAKLNVDKKGVEGAAVTVLVGEATSAPFDEPDRYYHDFILGREFAFILTDPADVILFAGHVADPYGDRAASGEDGLLSGIEERYDGTFAVDVMQDPSYRADGVTGVRFTVKASPDDYYAPLEAVSVEGPAEGTAEIVRGDDGAFEITVRDADLLSSVPDGETLMKIVFGRAVNQQIIFTAEAVLDSFEIVGTELLREEKPAGDPVRDPGDVTVPAPDPVAKAPKTGDPAILAAVLSALAIGGAALIRKRVK